LIMRRPLRFATARTLLLNTGGLTSPRPFPAWIHAADGGRIGPVGVIPRVRDGLVLRLVAGRRVGAAGQFYHASGRR